MAKSLAEKRAYYRSVYQKYKARYAPTAKARMIEWRRKNKGKCREKKWAEQGIVGMTWEKYLKFLQLQGGACGICNKIIGETAHVDHDHITGEIRGLLCGNCNRALGLFGDSTEILAAAHYYLKAFKENQ